MRVAPGNYNHIPWSFKTRWFECDCWRRCGQEGAWGLYSRLGLKCSGRLCSLFIQSPKTLPQAAIGDLLTDFQKKEKEAFFRQIPRTKVCFPPMPGQVSCMHSKLQLLFHNTHTRIAIPTANLVNFDWGEGGIMENASLLFFVAYASELTNIDGLPH
jgi:hypothetical protein